MTIALLLAPLFNYLPSISYYLIIYTVQFFEVSVCSAFFVFNLERRKHFIWYLILYFVLAIGLIFLFSYLRTLFNDSTLIRMILTFLIYIFAFGMINLLFKSSMVMNCTITIRILAVRELTDAIFNIIILLSGNDTRHTIEIVPNAGNYVNALLYDVIHIAFHLTFALIFNSKLINHEKDKKLLSQYGVLGLIIVSFMCVIKTFVLEYEPESYILYILSMVLIGLLSLCVLAMQYFILKGRDYRQEINLMERVLYFEKKQYETVKESIESINMKCHDIKHQLDNFQGKLTTEEVELLKKSVEIYDLSIRTGNQNLDTILYEKQLLCNKHQIRLDILADGQAIYFMSDVHLHTLLNNALTNALESVSKVEDSSKRLIGFILRNQDQDVYLEIYNYFKGEVISSDIEQIKTTKEDKNHHGLGLKSIKHIVDFYHGTMDIKVDNEKGMFFLKINFPKNKHSSH